MRTVVPQAEHELAPDVASTREADPQTDGTGAAAVRKPPGSLANAADAAVLALRVAHLEMLRDLMPDEARLAALFEESGNASERFAIRLIEGLSREDEFLLKEEYLAVLALRIRHGDLLAHALASDEGFDWLPNEGRLAELSSELAEVLSRLKETYPAFARFRVRPRNAFGVLKVRFDEEFGSVVQDVAQAAANMRGDRAAALRTGHAAFDRLNEKMGLRHIDVWGDLWEGQISANLHLHQHANLDIAARLYAAAVDGIEWAAPSGRVWEESDIDATPTAEGWRIRIYNRWGDCPSGCMRRENFLFVAEGETVKRIHYEGSPECPSRPRWERRPECLPK